jgi:predicted ABC-type ATPase
MQSNKIIHVFAGPNGSGKSSIVNYLMKIDCINDEFICPDNIVDKTNPNVKKAYLEAMKYAEDKRNECVENGVSFSFETVLSNPEKLNFLRAASEKGFFIDLTYVGTSSSDINIERVKRRVSEGGHSVPIDKIRSRYQKSLELLFDVFKIADKAYIYDNSGAEPIRFVEKANGKIKINANPPEWIKRFLIDKITSRP